MTKGENTMIRRFVDAAIARGCTIRGVNDGEEFSACSNVDDAIRLCGAVDESRLCFLTHDGHRCSAFIVLGNAEDGSEVIADHSDTAEMNAAWNAVFGG